MLKRLSQTRARELVAAAAEAPLSDPSVDYPPWYVQRWHFLPEGYLSRRGAAAYDLLVRNLYNACMERRVIDQLVGLLRHHRPKSLLELGCGPGRFLSALDATEPRIRAAGVDLSPYHLERARARLHPEWPGDLVHASGHALPWDEQQFDAVVAIHYFGHVPGHAQSTALAEAARVLRPGGRLYTVDHAWHPKPPQTRLGPVSHDSALLGTLRVSVLERLADHTYPTHPIHDVAAAEAEESLV
jgi:SAM-dependent methyltransferase